MTHISVQTLLSDTCKRKKLKISPMKLLTPVSVFIHLFIQKKHYRFNDRIPLIRKQRHSQQRPRHRKIIWRMKKSLAYSLTVLFLSDYNINLFVKNVGARLGIKELKHWTGTEISFLKKFIYKWKLTKQN